MLINHVNCDIIEMACRQLGASVVRKIQGTLYIFEFDINENYKLSYSFNVNHKNEYHLHRLKPYPFLRTSITTAREVTDFIKSDLARFTNAVNSRNFDELIDTEKEIELIGQEIDTLFLNFNVDGKALSTIKNNLNDIRRQIQEVQTESAKINIEKIMEPEESIENANPDEIDEMLQYSYNKD